MAPTPESAAFLAKKPTVAPSFDGVDYDDTPRLKQAQDAILREQWVRSMMARLVREEMGKCYYREGVNHLEKCGALRGMPWSGCRRTISIGCAQNPMIRLEASVHDTVTDSDTDRYFELLKESKIRGYLFQQQNYLPEK